MLRTGLEPAHPFGHQPLKMAETIFQACKGLQQNASICSNYRRRKEIGQADVQGLAAICMDCEKNNVTDNVTGLHREAATTRKSDALLDMPEPVRPSAAFISVGRGLFPLFVSAGFVE